MKRLIHSVSRATDFGRVAVLMGGWAAEREISLRSGTAVLEALQQGGVDAYGIDVRTDFVQRLVGEHFDRAFIMLHGCGGEDGVVQGVLESLDIPYTGSGILASAVGMDKLRCKQIWRGVGLPTPDFERVTTHSDTAMVNQRMGMPLAIKPTYEGSSIGISKVASAEQLGAAITTAARYGEVLAEQWIEGSEYTVAILGDKVLPSIRLVTPHTFYDYAAKYDVDTTQYHSPSGLTEDDEVQLSELALGAFRTIGGYAWGRIDVMRGDDGRWWLLEINTVPGMTTHSLVPMAAHAAGINFQSLVWRILESAFVEQDRDG